MSIPNNATGVVCQGTALYVNHALKNGDFAWMVDLKTQQITIGCIFQPTEKPGNVAYTMYFVPNKAFVTMPYEPDFEHTVKVDNLIFAKTYDDAKAYLDNIKNTENRASGNPSDFHDGVRAWLIDSAKDEPVPCVLTNLRIDGEAKKIAIPITAHNPDGTVTVDYNRMFSVDGHRFSANYLEAKRQLDATKQRPKSRWKNDLAAASRLAQDVTAETDANIVKMPASAAVQSLQCYMDAVYGTNKLSIKINIVLTNVGEWYCLLRGPFSSDNLRVIQTVYQDNDITVRPDIIAKGVLCRRICEKLLQRTTGLNIRTSVIIPGTSQINLVCD